MTTSTLMLPVAGEQDLASWAAVAFVASYASPGTRQANATQLRLWFDWCERHHREPLADVRRPHVELYARDLEARSDAGHGRAQAGRVPRVLPLLRRGTAPRTLSGRPRRRPKISQESTRLGLDRTERGAFLVQAGLSGGNDHALACLLALNALRVSEACGADLSDLALANGHRVVSIVGKGNQPALIPLAPRTSRAIDTAVGEPPTGRCSLGPMAAVSTGTPLVGSCVGSRSAPGSTSPSRPTRCGTLRSPPHSTPGAASATCRTSPGMPTHDRHAATTAPAARSTATPPTSSPPTSREPTEPGTGSIDGHGCPAPTRQP
jgi:integrase/recombinase XerD